MTRRACLAIGVGTVTPQPDQAARFAHLDGAVIAARTIGTWALRSGFGEANVRVVDDEAIDGRDNPVTCERVQQAVNALFPAGAEPVGQLILAFCGHGLTDANFGSVSWLFSDSLLMKYRVVADRFYAELLLHGVQRITLISDACREAPKELEQMRLDAVRGIVVQGAQPASPKVDRLDACQDGHRAYMVSDPMSALPGKCVFSGVIADALWGIEPTAIDNGAITISTLGNCVLTRAVERAREYRLDLNPTCAIHPAPAVLRQSADPLPDPSELQPWPPPPESPTPPPRPPAARDAEGAGDGSDEASADEVLERVYTDASFRKLILGPRFGTGDDAQAEEAIPFFDAFKIPARSGHLLEELVSLRRIRNPTPRIEHEIQVLVDRVVGDVLSEAQRSTAETVKNRLDDVWRFSRAMGDHPRADVIVWGHSGGIVSRSPVQDVEPAPDMVRFRVNRMEDEGPVLVVLDGGRWIPVIPYRSLFAAVVPGDDGDVFQAYGSRNLHEPYDMAPLVIREFASGGIKPSDVDQIAAMLRGAKHVDPVLGAICAHLYRATADFDSIRRMAYFYAYYNQAVPFDVALLGSMPVTRTKHGGLRLHVPAVEAREPDAWGAWAADRLPAYVTQSTEPVTARIGGRCPWLGLGWDYVTEPRPEWAALVEGLADYAGSVRRSGFTVLPEEAGRELAAMWDLTLR